MKNFSIKILVVLLVSFITLSNIYVNEVHALPYIEAQGVVLMDGITGEVLYNKNGDTQFEPASTTKIMTAIVVLENVSLNDKVTIGSNPPMVDGSALGIKEGETYTVEELLLALLLESSNDCAEALAEYVVGLQGPEANAAFGNLMTIKAKELGAKNTTFKNPSGLSEEGHLTTAYDLSLIMRYALNNDDLVRISRVISYKYENNPFSDGTEKWATNRNNCYVDWSPWYYDKLYTGKIGYTPEANHTYTASAVKDDQVLVASFLNAYNKDAQYTSVGPLFDWGFENFSTHKIVEKDEELGTYTLSSDTLVPLLSTKDIYKVFNTGESTTVEKTIFYEDRDLSKESIKKGEILFNAILKVNGEDFDVLPLVSGIDREYTLQVKVDQTFDKIIENKWLYIGGAICLFIVIYLAYYFISHYRKRSYFKRKYNL